jgi:hypothetical protein
LPNHLGGGGGGGGPPPPPPPPNDLASSATVGNRWLLDIDIVSDTYIWPLVNVWIC